MLLAIVLLGWLVWRFGLWRLLGWLVRAMLGAFVSGIHTRSRA